jgi:hypothetical protein
MHKNRENAARNALARLMTMPPDSPEVELELDEIATALEADRALGQGSYIGWYSMFSNVLTRANCQLDCFRNTEAKNGLRTWTGIWLQAVGPF